MSGAQGTKLSWTSIFLYSAYLFSSYSPMQILWQSPESRGRKYILPRIQFTSVQLLSHIQLFATPWIAACQASLSITNSRSSPKLMSIELVMPSSHFILCRPLLLLFSGCWALRQLFHSPLSLSSRGFLFLLHFLPEGWCHLHTEVIDISPGNLDSSLCFFQPSVSHLQA